MALNKEKAICFQHDSSSMSDVYWPVDEILANWDAERNDDGCISIDYSSLFQIVKKTSIHFITLLKTIGRNYVQNKIDDNLSQNQLQPIIAISITEGPYLPLAVFVIHILNSLPPDEEDNNHKWSHNTIMMPLDPEDGVERIKHMILDTKPNFILCVDGEHRENIVKAISEIHRLNVFPSKKMVNRILDIQVLNFATIVSEALKVHESQSHIPFDTQITKHLDRIHSCTQKDFFKNIISHIVYTSGTTGVPKGCICSLASLMNYIPAKNEAHGLTNVTNPNIFLNNSKRNEVVTSKDKRVLLASALPFDPCLSDILATFYAHSTLIISSKVQIQRNLKNLLNLLRVTHVLCTPTLWSTIKISQSPSLYEQFPFLEVVALGGEPIPKQIVAQWARKKFIKIENEQSKEQQMKNVKHSYAKTKALSNESNKVCGIKLMATYGVTEACVYQTMGEVFHEVIEIDCNSCQRLQNNVPVLRQPELGQDVGVPFRGSIIRIRKGSKQRSTPIEHIDEIPICSESEEDSFMKSDPNIGEIIIFGAQVDALSGYLNLPKLTIEKFISSAMFANDHASIGYCTGDRGYINSKNGHLHILGRIDGEEGMIKVNGVRVELGEIEAGIVDDFTKIPYFLKETNDSTVIERAIVTVKTKDDGKKLLTAYIVLSEKCRNEIGISFQSMDIPVNNERQDLRIPGILCTPGPLLSLLHGRAQRRIRKNCSPSTFIIIENIPLTSTGKCNRKVLPTIESCAPLSASILNVALPIRKTLRNKPAVPLRQYGKSGFFVSEELIRCLNLQKSQTSLLTTEANFTLLGGDSLAATIVTRSLYAKHHGIANSRNIGGSTGTLDEPFNVENLLNASTLQKYVDYLDDFGVCQAKGEVCEDDRDSKKQKVKKKINFKSDPYDFLFDSLMEAIALDQINIALGLLDLDIDPNHGEHGNRIGKIRDRNERRKKFYSNPLHLACLRGNVTLVNALIECGCNCKSPDANGSFPIHLACIGNRKTSCAQMCLSDERIHEDLQRIECVKALLNNGKVPLTMKDSSKQTVLHSAARSGHLKLLEFLMNVWSKDTNIRELKAWGSKFDWQDRWFRTPVHWAVLNGNVDALEILLKYGCNANPPQPRKSVSGRSTSAAIESPIEICQRLYDVKSGIGRSIIDLLRVPH